MVLMPRAQRVLGSAQERVPAPSQPRGSVQGVHREAVRPRASSQQRGASPDLRGREAPSPEVELVVYSLWKIAGVGKESGKSTLGFTLTFTWCSLWFVFLFWYE